LSEHRIVINCISCLVHARLARMKERFTLVRRAYPERVSRQTVVAHGRWYRRIGRVCLLAAAVAGGVEIFDTLRGVQLPPLTLRSVLDLSPDVAAPGIAPLQAAIELVVDSPLWIVLIVAGAIPYGLAIERFLKAA
jgi:hypothetical protein